MFSYFLPGDLLTLDAHSHLARTWLFKDILFNEHQFPFWTNRWYFGFPLELYYGFLYYLLNGLCTFLTGNLVWGTKLFLWALHLLSGLCFYALARHLTYSRLAALFGALFFVLSPQHLGAFVEGGRHALSPIFLLLPVIFYYYECCQQEQRVVRKAAPTLALFLALALFTHLQFGFYTLAAFLLVSVPRTLIQAFARETRDLARYNVRLLFWAGVFYLLFTAWMIFPALQDSHYLVQGNSDTFRVLIGKWNPNKALSIIKQFVWTGNNSFDHIYYVGIVGLCAALLAYNPRRLSAVALSYGLAFGVTFFWMLHATRLSYFAFFFVAVLSAYGIKQIKHVFAAVLCLLLLIDLVPHLRTAPYKKIHNEAVAILSQKMHENSIMGRILVLHDNRRTLWSSLDVIDTNASSAFGGIPQNATLSHPYMAAICTQASHEVFDLRQPLSSSTIDAFRLLNIREVIIPTRKIEMEIDGAQPLWFSSKRILPKNGPHSLEHETWLTVRKKYDARSFGSQEDDLKSLDGEFEKASFKVLSCKETHSVVQIEYESQTDGFGWLSYAYFPYHHVTLDGISIPFYESAMHFMAVPLKKGRHALQIEAGISPLRKVLGLLALAAFCYFLISYFKRYKNT